MKHIMVEQGSGAWYRVRLGVPTASNFDKIITPGGKASTQARKYKYRLIAERLLRESQDDEIGHVKWVAAGKENEPYAVAHFQEVEGIELKKCGFIITDDGRLGASPDRLIGVREAIEIKCPAAFTQIGYLLDGIVEKDLEQYTPQVQGQILVGEFECVHFYSWHSRMPPFHKITLPMPNYQATMRGLLNQFCDELDRDTERAKALGAYAVSTEIITPSEAAYSEEEPYRLVFPGGGGDLGSA
jgi:hypothetical protein